MKATIQVSTFVQESGGTYSFIMDRDPALEGPKCQATDLLIKKKMSFSMKIS